MKKSDRQLPGSGIKVVSFFSGGGGLDLGFEMAGFDVVFATDIQKVFCETLEANKGKYLSSHLEVCNKDIRLIDISEIPEGAELVIGGPPCQSFSASNRRAGGAAGRLDERGTLFEAYCKLISEIKPKAFLFENVRGILGTNSGEDWKEIVKAFSSIGYRVSHRVLDACDYGIPQQRERLFLFGHKLNDEFLFPEPMYGSDSTSGRPYITPREALARVPVEEDLDDLVLRNGKYAHLLPLVPPGGNYLFFTAKRGYPNPIFAYRSRFSDFLYKADPDHTIKTLIASPGQYSGPFHWENRSFTVAEYKRLQGFPDDYNFCGARSEVIRQIGNSVSPKIAKALALAIAKQIFDRDVDMRLLPVDAQLSFDKRKSAKAKNTKSHHDKVVSMKFAQKQPADAVFSFRDYSAHVTPTTCASKVDNVFAQAEDRLIKLKVYSEQSEKIFAKMRMEINSSDQMPLFRNNEPEADAVIELELYGTEPHCIQTMWNAVDDLVIRSSSFHSLFELYGHFTEPHPIFSIVEFETFSPHPIAKFAAHTADFKNCSRHFNKSHLTRMFGDVFGTHNFLELVEILRGYRFDIRCYETNVAMPRDVYMVSYPFTLPHRRQMNFSVRKSG